MAIEITRRLSKEELQLPDFNFKEVEALYEHDLTIPDELYDSLLKKDRKILIEDLEKLLQHAVNQFDIFKLDDISLENTFFVWHAVFLLRDLRASESLPAYLHFLKQDENLVEFYLGDAMGVFGWEFFYALGSENLRLLVDQVKDADLTDDYTYRTEIIEAIKQVGLHQPERELEVESYLRELLLFTGTVSNKDDSFIDEVTDKVLEAIGNLRLTRLYPEVEKLLEQEKLPSIFVRDMEDFEDQYIIFDSKAITADLKSRKERYSEFINPIQEGDDFDDDDDDLYNDFDPFLDEPYEDDADEDVLEDEDEDGPRHKDGDYIDYEESPTPYVKKEPDVGRNDPCPCGSGKKYKKCHGKS